MRQTTRYVLSGVGALVLVGSALTDAFASHPPTFHDLVPGQRATANFNGNVRIRHVLRVDNNSSVYGKLYAHGGGQAWKGFLVHDGGLTIQSGGVTVDTGGLTIAAGGLKSDSLSVSGPLQAASGTFSGNLTSGTLQSGSISGATLTTTGAATIGAALTAPTVNAGTITDSGALSAHDLTVTGNVNFTGATVSGISLSTLGLTNLSSLTVGTTQGTAAPFSIAQNGSTVQLGATAGGALSVPSLATTNDLSVGGSMTVAKTAVVAGNLVVNGAAGVTASSLTGAATSGTTSAGPLTLTGSTISLAGPVSETGDFTLNGGSNINLSASANFSNASHVNANGDTDVAGQITVGPCALPASSPCTSTYTFRTAYATMPIVTLTPAGDPETVGGTPKYWVQVTQSANSGPYTSFTVYYVPESVGAGSTTVSAVFNYHVIGK